MKNLFILSLLCLIGLSCAHGTKRYPASQLEIISEGKNENPRPKKWPSVIWHKILNVTDDGLYSLTNALFDVIEEFNSDVLNLSHFKTGIRVKREVFDNQDVLNSFTVVDHFRLRLASKNINIAAPLGLSNVSLGFRLGAGTDIDWTNIRQVTASRYPNFPTIEHENKELLSKKEEELIENPTPDAKEVFIQEEDDDGVVREITTYDSGGYFIDPSFRPRISKLFNMITFPWKVPLTLKKLSKLKEGELISYSFTGYVEVGANVGFKIIPNIDDKVVFNNLANFRTFLKGTFKVTVLKENERFVRVKLSRIREHGMALTLGGDGTKVEVFEGFLLFSGSDIEMDKVLKQKVSVIPFKFTTQKSWANSFDLGFRYDMQFEEAREAYKKAVFGSFKYSSDYAGRVDKNDNPAITRIFKRNANTINRITDQSLRLFVYRNYKGRISKSLNAVIELPDGTKEVFKESTELSRGWKVFWGHFEKMQFNFTIAFDKTSFLEGKDNSLQLIAEGNIEDSHTNGKEMFRYIHMVRKAIGKNEVLPDLPVYIPKNHLELEAQDVLEGEDPYQESYGLSKRLAKYKRSNFYFGYNINQFQLEKLVAYPEEKMWDALERAFGVKEGAWSTSGSRTWYRTKNIWASIANLPLFLMNANIRKGNDLEAAKRFIKWWKRLKVKMPLDHKGKFIITEEFSEKIQYFARMFKNRNFGYQYLRALFIALNGEEVDYFVTATNESFGRIQERGRVTTNPEYLMNLTDENIGFERLAGGFKSNPDLLVNNLKAEMLDQEKVVLSFETNKKPQIIYFKIFKTNRLQKYRVVSELVYKNESRFDVGFNRLVLDKKSLDELSFKLGENLEEGSYYTINVSISNDGFSWSQVNSKRFLYKLYEKNQLEEAN